MSKVINTPKLIAFDVDGCVLNFIEGFKAWMTDRYGLVTERDEEHIISHESFIQDLYPDFPSPPLADVLAEFNAHSAYAQLKPYPHAVDAVQEIRNAFPGVRCVAVSSVPVNELQIQLRRQQLAPFALDDFTPVGLGQLKADHLFRIGACLLFDDYHAQIEAAEAKGIKAIMVTRAWNKHHPHPHRLNNWQQAVAAIHHRFTI